MGARFPLKALTFAITTPAVITACGTLSGESAMNEEPATPANVVEQYTDVAYATYHDALKTARALDKATDALIANPTADNLATAKAAWLEARVPYQQSEVFRFGNAIVDDWEGQLNAWPLDEGLIDYVEINDYQYELGNEGATVNIIASETVNVGGESVDVAVLTPELLAELNEIGGSEANVATGYHAIEFLLWGQDRHGFESGNGERPVTDYATDSDCTHGNCERRAAYLDAVTDLLVSDLEWMASQWAPGSSDNYRAELLAMEPQAAIQKMLFGMGSLSLGELAGERMKVALEANSYEDEHDCFSDNTHNSHYYNAIGIRNVYTGSYTRVDGSTITGPSLSDLVAATDPELDKRLRSDLNSSVKALQSMKDRAEASSNAMTFDMMIAPGNEEGAAMINDAISALVAQTGSIEKASNILGVASLQPDDAGHTF
ncbi:imelysin family protein [Marinobacter nanhaiticus D15-8W]|uniref:Peptidase n=1 Tax=Marinobacter nanhaiticus D15-8W TaxID=626887 RepID=N6WQ40_9GAMM|nr:imelysin family protein [Marinobacter nanhaiticus]ENO13162.1 peptidase [Marinobacter nanhaiticus D15-8W]BES70522.1 imelysin family protein [Marinobacter nanhaiticus D15-8W]